MHPPSPSTRNLVNIIYKWHTKVSKNNIHLNTYIADYTFVVENSSLSATVWTRAGQQEVCCKHTTTCVQHNDYQKYHHFFTKKRHLKQRYIIISTWAHLHRPTEGQQKALHNSHNHLFTNVGLSPRSRWRWPAGGRRVRHRRCHRLGRRRPSSQPLPDTRAPHSWQTQTTNTPQH